MQALRNVLFLLHGTQNFTQSAYRKKSEKFSQSPSEQEDLTGKVCVVTGANQGIGKAAALALAKRGAQVHLVCRNKGRGEEAAEDIRSSTGNPNITVQVCDLSSLSDVTALSRRLQHEPGSVVHVLVNNAGIMEQKHVLSPDGYEMNFAVNVLGTFALTESLLPALQRGGPDSKVVTVATGGILTQPLSKDLQMEKRFDGTEAYARNKRVQVALTEKWADKYASTGVGFYSMHPGWVDTTTLQNSMPGFYSTYKASLRTPDEGADTIDWLAATKNEFLKPGAFYFDRAESTKHLPLAGTQYKLADVDEIYVMVRRMSKLDEQ